MVKTFIKNKPAIAITMVGFGQAGSRIADEFAYFRNSEGKSTYNCLALNSNDGDLKGLKNIINENRVSLNLGGLGKNPEKAITILEENEEAREKLKSFINDKVRPEDDLVLFFAGLGGGTGTATIVKAIDEFYEYQNKPLIIEEFNKLKASVDPIELKKNQQKYANMAFAKAKEKFKKIGVVVTLPLRTDGPDVLRQVNDFAQQIWALAKNPTKGIAFVTFADNQHFYDEFKKIPLHEQNEIENYRDYGNKQIANIFHELNTATTQGGSDVVMDSQDFRRAIMESAGSLVLSKSEMPIEDVITGEQIVDLFKNNLKENSLHKPLKLVWKEDNKLMKKNVHHVGILSVIDGVKDFKGGAFLDDAIVHIHDQMPINGTVFSGYINTRNDFNVTSYTFYKVDGLPERLEKGLVAEYREYMDRNQDYQIDKTEIVSIAPKKEETIDFDFSDLFGDLQEPETNENDETKEEGPTTDELMAALNFKE